LRAASASWTGAFGERSPERGRAGKRLEGCRAARSFHGLSTGAFKYRTDVEWGWTEKNDVISVG